MLTNYEDRLNAIKQLLNEMGAAVIEANEKTLEGFRYSNSEKLNEARVLLKNIDDNGNKIDNNIVTTLALFGPEATDLRELISYLKITSELVRIGENTKSYAKCMKNQLKSDLDFEELSEYAIHLHQSAINALRLAIETFEISDKDEIESAFRKVKIEESKTDDIYTILEKNILAKVCAVLDDTADYIKVLSTMRKLERIADRSVNIAKLMVFAEKGGKIKQH